jgi:uncharacterized alkaline shock family protein YloU
MKNPPRPPKVADIEKGSLNCKIADSVIEKIVYNETLGIEGIMRFGGVDHKENFNLFQRGRRPRGITVEIGEEEVAVKMSITVKYGVNIPQLADTIKQKITQAINGMTGYEVRAISIEVDQIQIGSKEEKPQDKKAKRAEAGAAD